MKVNQHQVYRLKIDKFGKLIAERQQPQKATIKKRPPRPVDWICTLAPGEYTMREIKAISGSNNKTALLQKMIRHGARVENIFDKEKNLVKNLIIWDGYKERKGA